MKLYWSKDKASEVEFISNYPTEFLEDPGQLFSEEKVDIQTDAIDHHSIHIAMDGVRISFLSKSLVNDVSHFIRSDSPYLQMHFELSGSAIYRSGERGGMDCLIPSGTHTLFYMPALYGQLTYPRVRRSISVEIEVTVAYLKRMLGADLQLLDDFADRIRDEVPVMMGGRSFPVTRKMNQVLMEMYHCPFTGELKKLFLDAKLLELLILQLDQIGKADQDVLGKLPVGNKDLDRIWEVRRLIENSIDSPPSIIELSEMVGMNRTKLQQIFKEVHGTTIYGLLADLRMATADRLLQTRPDMKIIEIAHRIGYKNPNHFSAAYKKKFGVSPKGTK